jgi:endo-1,4-beta-xylanase
MLGVVRVCAAAPPRLLLLPLRPLLQTARWGSHSCNRQKRLSHRRFTATRGGRTSREPNQSYMIITTLGIAAVSLAAAPTYETLTTTCKDASPISGALSVSSVAECEARCNSNGRCNSLDTDGSTCYLKSHCEGAVGSCSGWCGHRQKGAPTPPGPTPPTPPAPPLNGTLRAAADKRGIWMGSCGNKGHLGSDPQYSEVLGQQYSLVTAENACKWGALRPSQDVFAFADCDAILAYTKENQQAFRGHNLCWGQYNPSWLEHGGFSPSEKRALLINHTTTVAAHYGGDAVAWDVVNEAIDDNMHPGQPYTFKPSVWFPDVPNFVDVAFNATAKAFKGKLFYNDYNIASMSEGAFEYHPATRERLSGPSKRKSDAVFAMLRGMLARGVPVHGVGMQLHVDHSFDSFEGVSQNMARLASLGLDIHFTEIDVACPSGCDLAQQARVYAGLLSVCLAEPACKNFETWGFTDKYTWKGTGQRPLPFDEQLKPKPAFDALLAALRSNSTHGPSVH